MVKSKTCFYCKGPLRKKKIEHMHQWGDQRFLIQNVSAEACQQCGEVFLAPSTLKEIDRIVTKRKPDGHVSIAVYQLKTRAV